MENTRNIPLGAAGLNSLMSDFELAVTMRRAIRSVPYISGVNNHMGSVLTQNKRAMTALMKELQGYPLYFVDSRTTSLSIAHQTASHHRIPALNRDIFLDNDINTPYIHQQFRKLVAIARKNGTAIAIGHPYQETVSYLEKTLPQLGKEGIAIATIKGVWSIRNNAASMFADRASTEGKPLLAKSRGKKTIEEIN